MAIKAWSSAGLKLYHGRGFRREERGADLTLMLESLDPRAVGLPNLPADEYLFDDSPRSPKVFLDPRLDIRK